MNPERAMVIVAHPDDAESLAGAGAFLWELLQRIDSR
jgi:LmbE family N-acetylglucosaminyl deacetylase